MDDNCRRWCVVLEGNARIHAWDDDDLVVVYNKASGDTHLLEPLAGVLLQMIESDSCTTEKLVMDCADAFLDKDKSNAVAAIEATLIQLRDVGLVFSTPN